MINNETAVEVFKYLLKKVSEAEIPLISLRPREINEEVSYSGDYDFFIPLEFVDTLLVLMHEIAVQTRTSFSITRRQHGKIDITLYSRLDNKAIALEIWNFLTVKDPLKKTLRYIRPENLKLLIKKDENNQYSLPIEVEALYYLSHMYTGKKKLSTPLVKKRINYYIYELDSIGSKYVGIYKKLISSQIDLKTAAHEANMELVNKNLLKLKTDVKGQFLELLLRIDSTKNRVKRKILSFNHMIPIVGPDGVGKTSLIDSVQKKSDINVGVFKFKKTFRVSPFYKLLVSFLSKSIQKETQANDKPGKTEVDDRYGNFVIFNACLLFPLRLIKNMFSKKIIFIDRYFNEYLLINTRWQTQNLGLRSDWKFLLKFIPRTYSIIHLDAPTELILTRKAELSEKGIEAYRGLLFKTFLEKPSIVYTYINTELELEKCSKLALNVSKIKSRESKIK